MDESYFETNRQSWNNRTEYHLKSDFYDMENFLAGKNSLNEIELKLLGDIEGKKILHLQCHFGQDSMSLSRLGAKVTGVDLSDKAIEKAQSIAKGINLDTEFLYCNIYDLPKSLDQTFDIVFTSYGAISWLPDLNAWGKIISQFLKPNGKFIFVEFHPVVWMYDDLFSKVAYSYFNKQAILETENGTYADRNAKVKLESVVWNHSLSDVIQSLILNGIEINSFLEYDYSPYNCFLETEEFLPKKYRIKHFENKIPMVYSIVGIKK